MSFFINPVNNIIDSRSNCCPNYPVVINKGYCEVICNNDNAA